MIWPLPKIKFAGPTPDTTNQYPAVERVRVRVIASETHSDDGAGTPSAEFSFDHEWEFSRCYAPTAPAAGEFTLTEASDQPADWNVASVGDAWVDAGGFVITDGGTDARDLTVTPEISRLAAANPGGAALPRPTAAAPGSTLKLALGLAFSGAPGNWSLTAEAFELEISVPDMAAVRVPPLLLTAAGTDSFTYLGVGTVTVDREWDVEVEFLGP